MGLSPINGGAAEYVNAGALKFGIHYLQSSQTSSSTPLILDVYVIDYGSEEKARAAFELFKPANGAALSGFSKNDVIVDEASIAFGCLAHACFGKFYLELRFNNYSVKSMSLEDAAVFVSVYRKKIKG